jgi:signal transduction histidine kinase
LHETWDRLEATRRGKSAQLRENDMQDVMIRGDRFRLVQVFRNIFDNALAARAQDVQIDVASSNIVLGGQAGVQISIKDNGPGLTAEQRRKLFEPFFTTKTHGTGLGMPIVKRIVEAHGGTIDVGPDSSHGAEIIITLLKGDS